MEAAERVREGEPVTEGLPDDAAALYELDPREFIAARNALVKRWRADRRQEQATAVAGRAGDLRSATAAERAAANAVIDAAREHPGGRTEGLRQAIVGTLRAAAGDPDVAAATPRRHPLVRARPRRVRLRLGCR